MIVYCQEADFNFASGFLISALKNDGYEVEISHDPELECLVKTTMPDGTVIRSTVEYDRWKTWNQR